jgi:hypothetical protein
MDKVKSIARLAQSVERKALNLVVVGGGLVTTTNQNIPCRESQCFFLKKRIGSYDDKR